MKLKGFTPNVVIVNIISCLHWSGKGVLILRKEQRRVLRDYCYCIVMSVEGKGIVSDDGVIVSWSAFDYYK